MKGKSGKTWGDKRVRYVVSREGDYKKAQKVKLAARGGSDGEIN